MTRPPLIRTRLTARYGLRSPILNAPMALVAGGALAAAVSRAGGLGLIGGGYAGTPRTFAFAPREKPAAQRAGEGLQHAPAPTLGSRQRHCDRTRQPLPWRPVSK